MATQFKIDTENRDRLYFDKWQYSIAVYQPRIGDLRGLDVEKVKATINWRRHTSSGWWRDRYTTEVIENLHHSLDVLVNETCEFKATFSGDWVNFYTNDVDFINRFSAACPYARIRYVKQALVTDPKDVLILAEPKYSFRSYMRGSWINESTIDQLRNFIKAQGTNLAPCGALRSFLTVRKGYQQHWLASHYFVEYNDPGYTVMLDLILPRRIRKTLPVVKRINN